jgi:hypothetical protein
MFTPKKWRVGYFGFLNRLTKPITMAITTPTRITMSMVEYSGTTVGSGGSGYSGIWLITA